MALFRLWLVVIMLALLVYTTMVIGAHGWGLIPIFFGDIGRMGWPGQFNLDFLFMLTLSALWVGWRHGWSGQGLLLSLLALFGGASFLSVYLLILTGAARGDMRKVLLGQHAM